MNTIFDDDTILFQFFYQLLIRKIEIASFLSIISVKCFFFLFNDDTISLLICVEDKRSEYIFMMQYTDAFIYFFPNNFKMQFL